MDENYIVKRKNTFRSLWRLYFMMYYCLGILPVNIDNLLKTLPGATKLGIGGVIASYLIVATISILMFGYYEDKITKKYSRKRIFIFTNIIWVIAYGLISISLNYFFFLIFMIIAAFGAGAFLPLAFSIVSDFYPPKERGKKFGLLHFGLTLGSGLGIILGGILGTYVGPNGWRFAYGLAFILGLLVIIGYYFLGIDPERGRAEPEFKDFDGVINYDYKITLSNLSQLFKKKSVATILIYMLCSGIATSTLGNWAIFYLTTKISAENAGFYATTIYILSGIGILPGAIIGGKIGDSFVRSGKLKGRTIISILGLISGIFCLLGFYLIPFFTKTLIQIIFSWIFFLVLGFSGYFLVSLCAGNIFAIYSEVCVPELRSTANAFNGLMVNMGGIIGNLLLSFLIESDMTLMPFAISLVLIIWLFGSLLWIVPFFTYPKESRELRNIMAERRIELDKKLR